MGHAVSDRAKALIKLAVEGFGCASGADTFHEQYGISQWLSPALGRRKATADKCCAAAGLEKRAVALEAIAAQQGILDTR
ncbi:MAG: hypothetical protein WCI11_21025, partial [Candidatus Methylumidiphilus sp.]